MSGEHFVDYYLCGLHVYRQCRCPGPKIKTITRQTCPKCLTSDAPQEDAATEERGMLPDDGTDFAAAVRAHEEQDSRRSQIPATILHSCKHAEDHGIAPHEYQNAAERMLESQTEAASLRARIEELERALEKAVEIGSTLIGGQRIPHPGEYIKAYADVDCILRAALHPRPSEGSKGTGCTCGLSGAHSCS